MPQPQQGGRKYTNYGYIKYTAVVIIMRLTLIIRIIYCTHARLQLRYRWGHLVTGDWTGSETQNTLSVERRKTLSITHHALSPSPSHHHRYIIHLINWLQRFYRITMSLKRPFVPKSDVKQWFTTTTTETQSLNKDVSMIAWNIKLAELPACPVTINIISMERDFTMFFKFYFIQNTF